MELVLLPHSPVRMSHTTGQLVEAEEAPLAVAGDPVKLPNMRWPIAHFALRLRMFPVMTDASIDHCQMFCLHDASHIVDKKKDDWHQAILGCPCLGPHESSWESCALPGLQ